MADIKDILTRVEEVKRANKVTDEATDTKARIPAPFDESNIYEKMEEAFNGIFDFTYELLSVDFQDLNHRQRMHRCVDVIKQTLDIFDHNNVTTDYIRQCEAEEGLKA